MLANPITDLTTHRVSSFHDDERRDSRGGDLQRMQGNGNSSPPFPEKRRDVGQLKGLVVCFHVIHDA